MHERALRTVLLIRSIDEGDEAGEVLSLTDRAEATRSAAQADRPLRGSGPGGALPRELERLLVRRAELLLEKLRARSPVVGQALALAGGVSWLGPLLLLLAFGAGVSLSVLDGSRKIDILSFPLLGVIAWNAVVYVLLIAARFAPRRAEPAAADSPLSRLYERWLRGRLGSLLHRSSLFNVPLSQALQRFARDWAGIARPMLVLRAKRLFHLCAALVALGLVAGLYARGIVLRYDAGWDSTFLGPSGVRTLLAVLYGPASALSGIALPGSDAALQALRWNGGAGGAPAAPWIHLIAVTALLYVVLPRTLLVLASSLGLLRLARRPALPASLLAYARALVLESGSAQGLSARVIAYGYEPTRESLAGLSALLSGALGGSIETGAAVAYGEEDAFAARLSAEPMPAADCHVLLMSLAATPEPENHGVMIAALRDRLRRDKNRGGLLVLVDEAGYAARMRGDPSFERRLTERRRAWQEFVARQGPQACIVDLSRTALDESAAAVRERVLTALQWPASG
jgi:hypothetical protein